MNVLPFLPAKQVARDLADKALAAFIIIHAALKRSHKLQQYSRRRDLNARMPNFQVVD